MNFFARKSILRLRRMLDAIRTGDFTMMLNTETLKGEERRLAEEINDTILEYRRKSMAKEAESDYYKALLDRVDAFIIVADGEGRIKWMNEKAISDLCGFRIPELSDLKAINQDFPNYLDSLKSGDQRIVNMHIHDHESQLKISMVRFSQTGIDLRLFTIENVQYVMQQSEMEAQRKLISVLTHEIMNSLSPIISLSDSLCEAMEVSDRKIDDTDMMALRTIHRRSQGLLSFVDNYRKLSRVPKPKCQWTRIHDIILTTKSLFSQPYIRYDVEDNNIELYVDGHQIEQVVINLVKNAVEATDSTLNPEVSITTRSDHSGRHFLITVSDNGCGIAPGCIDSIFVPFFTTKAEGSGIGLSISRQIVIQHGGIIKVKTDKGCTVFTIVLPLYYRIK